MTRLYDDILLEIYTVYVTNCMYYIRLEFSALFSYVNRIRNWEIYFFLFGNLMVITNLDPTKNLGSNFHPATDICLKLWNFSRASCWVSEITFLSKGDSLIVPAGPLDFSSLLDFSGLLDFPSLLDISSLLGIFLLDISS